MSDPGNSPMVKEAVNTVPGMEIEPNSPFILFRQKGEFDTTVEVAADKERTKLRFHVHAVCGLPGLEQHMQNRIAEQPSFDSHMVEERGEDIVGTGVSYFVHLTLPPLLPRAQAFEDAKAVGRDLVSRLKRFYLGIQPPRP